jgi:calcium-dependent protein kinase
MASLDHPNIVKYYETYDREDYLYLVMEYCSGGDLIDRLSDNEPFTEFHAANIMKKLMKAVIHCHSSKIIHRDIKPENVMFQKDGEVKLIDFDFAVNVTSMTESFVESNSSNSQSLHY